MSGILNVLLVFGLVLVANSIPLPTSSENTKSKLQTAPGGNPEDGSPNLRKVLYPTYARDPFGTDFYTNLDVGTSAYGRWGPMYRYSELFDRPMRSPSPSEQEESELSGERIPENDLEDLGYFLNSNRPAFVPFYSGIGKGR